MLPCHDNLLVSNMLHSLWFNTNNRFLNTIKSPSSLHFYSGSVIELEGPLPGGGATVRHISKGVGDTLLCSIAWASLVTLPENGLALTISFTVS